MRETGQRRSAAPRPLCSDGEAPVGERLLQLQQEWRYATEAAAVFGPNPGGHRDPKVVAADYETVLRELLAGGHAQGRQ